MPYKKTTALKKISAAIKQDKQLTKIQGSQGAGKTVAITMLLVDKFWRNPNMEITICSAERTKLMATAFDDFKKIMIEWNLWQRGIWNGQRSRFTFHDSKSGFIEFIGLDSDDVGKGRRRDIIYINEANKINLNKYADISARAKRVIIDFNPDSHFYAMDLNEDTTSITVTFEDNEHLPEAERLNILGYKSQGYHNPNLENYHFDENIKNKYWANKWRVYGQGLVGAIDGQIFTNWKRGEFDESLPKTYGIDWGLVDPFVLLEMAIDNSQKRIYLREKVYKTGLSSADIEALLTANVPKDAAIIADSADKRGIFDLRNTGFNIRPAFKRPGIVVSRIRQIMAYEIVVCGESPNIEFELGNYVWLDNRGDVPRDLHNHAMDTIGYVFTYLCRNLF